MFRTCIIFFIGHVTGYGECFSPGQCEFKQSKFENLCKIPGIMHDKCFESMFTISKIFHSYDLEQIGKYVSQSYSIFCVILPSTTRGNLKIR